MVYKGSVSYLNNTVHFVRISDAVEAKIETLDRATVQITFVDINGLQVPVPAKVTVTFADNNPVARIGNTFILSWVEDYVLKVDGEEHFQLKNQKQQAISGGPELQTRHV